MAKIKMIQIINIKKAQMLRTPTSINNGINVLSLIKNLKGKRN